MKRRAYLTSSALIIGLGVVASTGFTPEYSVPIYEKPTVKIWDVQSIDTMKVSRDRARERSINIDDIERQLGLIKETGATHVAIATPYDKEFNTFRSQWVNAARMHGLKVLFRGNHSGWEGWFEYPAITRQEHIRKTATFIRENPGIFENGDIFEPCPECENGGTGDPRRNGDAPGHRDFLKELHNVSQSEFKKQNKEVEILFSTNGDVAKLIFDKDTTETIGGTVALDHYVKTGKQISEDASAQALASNAKIYLNELGVPIPDIHGSLSEQEQWHWLLDAFDAIAKNRNISGVNYWVHIGGSTALWNLDETPRVGIAALERYYNPWSIYGVVVDTRGLPLEGVSVSNAFGLSITDEEGYFELPSVDEAVTAHAWKDEYIPVDITLNEEEAETQQLIVMDRVKESLLFRIQKALY